MKGIALGGPDEASVSPASARKTLAGDASAAARLDAPAADTAPGKT
jgi:hypothetical protein